MEKTTEKICPKCQTANPIAANFCRHCGSEFQSQPAVNKRESKDLRYDNIQNKLLSLQNQIKDYQIQESDWKKLAIDWEEKEMLYKAKQDEMQKKIKKLERQLNIEKKKTEQEIDKKTPSPQKKYSFKRLLIYTCIFIIGVLSHKCSCSGNNKQIEDDFKEIVPREADMPAQEESYVPIDFVLVPGGTLSYKGNYNEGYKKHRAEIDSFYICKFELTQGEYKRVIGTLSKENSMWLIVNSWYYDKGPEYSEVRGDSIPVRGNYRLFAEYCNARSKQEGFDGFYEIDGKSITINPEGNGYRLITPYEWIFAAYGGNLNKQEKYLGGKTLSEVAWHYGNSGSRPHPVGLKKPNVIGLYDIQGNAPELLQGDKKHRCYGSMCGQYNVSNWNYSQAYDPTYIWWLNKGGDEKEWTYGTRIAFIPKTIKNENLKIQYDYYE